MSLDRITLYYISLVESFNITNCNSVDSIIGKEYAPTGFLSAYLLLNRVVNTLVARCCTVAKIKVLAGLYSTDSFSIPRIKLVSLNVGDTLGVGAEAYFYLSNYFFVRIYGRC